MFAFDDALALQSALAAATDVAEALELYEAAQRPKIARFQETSFASMQWSETLIEAAERGDRGRVSELIAARWQGNDVPPGPLSSVQRDQSLERSWD